ncbi:MAG: threonine synthase [Ruminococcaceae bacterium]|nr:threonine synthase [Oscillospiraceae bacterium]
MMYQSTRDPAHKKYSAAEVIKMGLAPDGGLFIPETIPTLTEEEITALCGESYPVRAAKILSKFLSDYTYEEILADCEAAYAETSFPGGAAPLVHVRDNIYSLELWHGPTAAFKDMALQIMPRLLSRALVKTGETRDALILVATSGDTGKAALEGYKDIDRIKIMVFYPVDGVSRVQKLQMATQTGDNVNVCAIRGNFDDAQTGVKKIFGDADMAAQLNERGFVLSSANSINWGRLAPQIVYYVSAYCDLVNAGNLALGETMDVCVPTGNFGNIFAGYIAKLMGLPIRHFVCASNKNNILTDFLRTGTYDRNRAFHLTMSPSMDILISSNLERLLCFSAGEERTASYMEQLKMTGAYTVDADVLSEITANFSGYFADEQATAATIKSYFEHDHYLADTHTAVALSCAEQYLSTLSAEELRPIVVDSTASPYKFAADVYESLGKSQPADPLAALDELSIATGTEIPYPLCGLGERTVRFTTVIDADDMPAAVLDYCN